MEITQSTAPSFPVESPASQSYRVAEANSVQSAFAKVLELLQPWRSHERPYVWFRGVKDRALALLPGAYWRQDYGESDPLITFCQEGIPFVTVPGHNTWESYCLAQHHGIPTRLLDWTESFSSALFFAFDKWNASTVPCIWLLQPNLVNKLFINWEGVMAPECSGELANWLPNQISLDETLFKTDTEGFTYSNEYPLAIYPKRANRRIAAQRGVFTVHGRDRRALDVQLAAKSPDMSTILARLDFVDCSKDDVLYELALLGVRRSHVYPDVDNFVLEIKDQYGWE
jgi:hypothetical protein